MKSEKITSFYLDPADLEKWMYQNKAVYTGDFVEGCLLDNFMVQTKRGHAAIYEHYLNPNSSDYLVYFQPGCSQKLFAAFYIFEDAASAENC